MLLEDVKNHLDITWDDEAGDRKLSSLIESGKLYLCRTAGAELLFEGDDVDHGALILLKVYVMEKAYDCPGIRFIAKAQFFGEPFHNPLNGQSMLNVEGVFVITSKKFPGFFPG